MSEWRVSRSKALRCVKLGSDTADAHVYYDHNAEAWSVELRFFSSGDQSAWATFSSRRFASREAACAWADRVVAANLPLLAELAEV